MVGCSINMGGAAAEADTVLVAHTPTNYSAGSNTEESHFAGIDAALGNKLPTTGGKVTTLTRAYGVVPVGSMGASDYAGIAAYQSVLAAGYLVLNGSGIVNGKWSSGSEYVGRPIHVSSTSDLSGITVTVIGKTRRGVALEQTLTGPNKSTITFTSFGEVSRVSVSGGTGEATIRCGYGVPVVYVEPGLVEGLLVNEGAQNWSVYSAGTSMSGNTLAEGILYVKKDATPRTITFANNVTMTVKTIGDALATGNASKYVGYRYRAMRGLNTIFYMNDGAEA